MNRNLQRILGTLFWITTLAVAIFYGRFIMLLPTDQAAGVSLARFLWAPSNRVVALDPTGRLRVNDPIFMQIQGDRWRQIGYVTRVEAQQEPHRVTLDWYAADWEPSQTELVQYHSSGRLDEVLAAMLPPERRSRIQKRLAAAMSQHGEELSRAFLPLVQATLRASLPIIETELRSSIVAHRDEIEQLADRWNEQIVEQRLIPLARAEILPSVRAHGQPLAEDIGRELWNRASLFRFGWRAAYDRSPLPQRDLLREEWSRFVEEEAVPVFESYLDEIVEATESVVRDVVGNEVVRHELADVADQIVADPATEALLRSILREALIENVRLQEAWREIWQSDQARQAVEMAGQRLEPVVREIGDELFGTKEHGINPDFARVLRSQILGKDRRWIVAVPGDASSNIISVGAEKMLYPVVHTVADGEVPRE